MVWGDFFMSDILKAKENEKLWEWAGTRIVEFNCFPESVDELLPTQQSVYEEQGYEILDYYIKSCGNRLCTVELLIKPTKAYTNI